MAVYGISFYGDDTYGQKSFVEFRARGFKSTPYRYKTIRLSWVDPTGNWSRLRLVRNAYGYPVQESDGEVLLDLYAGPAAPTELQEPSPGGFDDTPLSPGRFYYYSLFVLAEPLEDAEEPLPAEWRLAGTTMGLVPFDHGYTGRLLDRIPGVMKTTTAEAGATSADTDTSMYRFMSLFGFELDFERTQHETLLRLYDPDWVSGNMLPLLADQFGLKYEPEIGVKQTRVLVRNLLTIRKRKGTLVAAEALATSFTGWSAEASRGYNLVLDYDDSSFEDSIGRWTATQNCTVGRYEGDDATYAYSAPDFLNRQEGALQINCTGGTAVVRLLEGRDPVLYGIPVEGGKPYAITAYARASAASAPRTSRIGVEWYDHRGVLIDSFMQAGTLNGTGDWDARPQTLQTAPANAVYAGLELRVTSATAGEQHYFDAIMLDQSSTVRPFQEARDARIVLRAERINEVPNPSAELNLTGWTALANSTLARATTHAYSGDPTVLTPAGNQLASFRVTSAVAGPVGFRSDPIPVLANTPYALSSWATSSIATTHNATVEWYDGTTLLGNSIGTAINHVVVGNNGAQEWSRGFVVSVSPTGTTHARLVLGAVATGASQVFRWDAVLLEHQIDVLEYFDAGHNPQRLSDYLWEGSEHASRSHYYFNRTTKNLRLRQLLREHLRDATSFSLIYAPPGLS